MSEREHNRFSDNETCVPMDSLQSCLVSCGEEMQISQQAHSDDRDEVGPDVEYVDQLQERQNLVHHCLCESLCLKDLKNAQNPNEVSQNATILSSQITNELEVKISECMKTTDNAKYVHPFCMRFSLTCAKSQGTEYRSMIGARIPLIIPREIPSKMDHIILRFSGLNIVVKEMTSNE
ncbi:hypothetical protein OGATHE_004817 [Ogataea polymorpha]|uniref:Uncharacterized protein n=1 Tax=Ogataea polymorpha TaxID=460523 RepID=A0A9P8T245_9ASCO|nr:hypothetical protein OGATHE_004817 [Ogataea polymorpha]